MASKKKIDFLRQVEQNKDENSVPPVKLYVRNKVLSSIDEVFVKLFLDSYVVKFIVIILYSKLLAGQ